MVEEKESRDRRRDTCAMYVDAEDAETGEPVGKRCFDPSCHGPESRGDNNYWTREILAGLKPYFGG